MAITKNIEDDKVTLIPEGFLDTANSPAFEECVDEVLANATVLTIDFSKIEYISSSGLRVLLKALKIMNAKNGEMNITRASDSIKDIFNLTGFSGILNII